MSAVEPELEPGHVLSGAVSGKPRCSCGWVPILGAPAFRAYDRHILEVRARTVEGTS